MNYILTIGEVKTLAGMLGARSFFSVEDELTELSRADVIQNVFQLTQRGFLVQQDEGFACEPAIKKMMQQLILAQHAFVLMVPGKVQLCCYVSDEACIVLEMTAERTKEYKLYAQPLREVYFGLCPPEDVISEQAPEMDVGELQFDAVPDTEHLSFQVDAYSLAAQRQLARGLVKKTPTGKAQAVYDGENITVEVYRQEELYRQIIERVRGEKI